MLLIRQAIGHADPIVGSGVQEIIVRNWEDTFETLEYLQHEGKEWDWVFFDDLSLYQDVGLDDVYEGILDQKGPKGSLARATRERFGPDRGEYRVNMWRLGQWVRHAVGSAEFNLGIMAHSFWWEPKGTDVQNVNTPACSWPGSRGSGCRRRFVG